MKRIAESILFHRNLWNFQFSCGVIRNAKEFSSMMDFFLLQNGDRGFNF